MQKNLEFTDSPTLSITMLWLRSNWLTILLVVAFGAGFGFRLSGLDAKIYSHDEALLSLYAAGFLDGDVLGSVWDGRTITPSDLQTFLKPSADKNFIDTLKNNAVNNPLEAPLFLLIASIWMRLVGHTPAVMRSLALLFGLFCIPAMVWLGQELFSSRRSVLFAAVLLTLSPYHILFSQDARPYSLFTLLILLSSAAFMRALRVNQGLSWLMYAATLALGMYTQQLFALVAITHALYFVSLRTTPWKRYYPGFLFASFIALLAYTPWLYYLILHWNEAMLRMDWVKMDIPWKLYIQRWAVIFASPFMDMNFALGNLIPFLLRAVVLAFVAVTLLYLVLRTPRQIWLFILLSGILPSAALILPDILLGGIRSINGRYLVPATIAIILAAAHFLALLTNRGSTVNRTIWQTATVILITLGIISNLNSLTADTWWNKEHCRVQPKIIEAINASNDAILIVSGHNATNIGDVLMLGLELDPDVRLRLYRQKDLDRIDFSSDGGTVFWMPASAAQAQNISQARQIQTSEVIHQTLWRIDTPGE